MLRSLLLALYVFSVFGAEPVAKTVPWVPSDRTIPHDTFAYKNITLKGTSTLQGQHIRATWDFGDGSAPVSFPVENANDVSTTHVYYGAPGNSFTAKLTVTDTTTGESGSAIYFVAMREKNLHTEANVAIDEGLWFLHRSMNRSNIGDVPAGNWNGDCRACDPSGAANAWNVLAFERHGHRESGDSSDPYTETVARGIKTLLHTVNVPNQIWIDAIAAADSPNTVASIGAEGVSGATYREILVKFVQASNGELVERASDREAEIETLLTKLAESADSPQAAVQTLVNRQDRLGYWYGHRTESNPALETPQTLLSMSKTPERAAGANSVLNVSPQVNVTNTGWHFSRATNTYIGNLTVTNTSGAPIPGPITVGILNLTAGVTPANSNGTFNGAPYVTVSGSAVNAGSSATVQLRFTNPSHAVISFNRITYSGTFPPASLSITCPASAGTLNTPYTSAYDANGGVRNYVYSTTGSLPSGLTLNPSTGAVTGAPDTQGNVSFTAVVTDSAGPATQTADASCSINIANGANGAPTANPQTTGTNEDTPVTITLTGSDPENANLTFSIVSGPTSGSLGTIVPVSANSASVQYTPALNFNGAASFTFKANDGTQDSAPAAVNINITAVNDAPTFTKGADQTVNADASAQTVPGWATLISAGPTADEAGQTLTFNITGNSNAALFSAGPAIAANGTLTYTPAASTSGSATVTITLSDSGGTANGGVNVSPSQQFIINVSNVNDAPSFTKGPDQTVNEDAGPQTVAGWATAISAGPPSESGQTLTFNVTGNTNPALFSAGPAIAANGTLTYTPAANANGSATITITLQDNGGTANGGVDTSPSQQFVINVTAVNDAPSFTKGADQTVLEDAGAQTVAGWATAMSPGPSDESAQTLSFSVTGNNNASLFSVAPLVADNGTLTYTPAANANGSATITVRLTDNGSNTAPNVNFSEQTFIINVTAVNDAPSFTKGANQTVNEDAALQTIAGWATAISAGPNEGSQTVSFGIDSNDNAALFTGTNGQAPAVAVNGTLTFRPALNKHGVANITLHIADNGGTANGGVDSSATQSFTITVNAVNDPPTAQVQSYNAQAHMQITIPQANGLLVGAADAADVAGNAGWTPTFTVGAINGVAPVSGVITTAVAGVGTIVANASTGAFTFDPAPGVMGTVSTTYTVCDNGEPAPSVCSATANLTFVIAGPVIWFVNPGGGAGTGTLANPFNSITAAASAMGTNTNHRVFVYTGSAAGNLTLTGAGTSAAAQWLIGQGTVAPATSFDAFMGISPPITTVLPRPALNGTNPVIAGTVTIGASSTSNNIIRGVTIQPPASSRGLVASSTGGSHMVGAATFPATSSDVAISTTSAAAVDLAGGGNGNFVFRSISTSSGANGILVNNFNASTGSFMVAGTGTAGSGGTIQNTTTRGVSFITSRNITLKSMNFTNAATNDFPAVPTGLSLGNNTGDNAAVHLQTLFNVTLDGLNISGSAEHAINGHNVTTFVLQNSSLTNAGNAADEDGIHFFNMLGTSSITNTTITSSGDDNVNIQNNTNLALPAGMTAVTSLTITGASANTGVLGSGYLMGIRGTSNTTVTIDSVTSNNNFSSGVVIDTFDTASTVLEVKNSTITNNNDGVSISGDCGSLKFDIHDNLSFAGTDFGRINVLKSAKPAGTTQCPAGQQGTVQGKIRNNPIVVTDGQTTDGISVFNAGPGTLTVAITNNTITYRGTQRAILIQGGQDNTVPSQLNATVTGNVIDMQIDGTNNPVTGILAQVAVASPSGNNMNMCLDVGGAGALRNDFTHTIAAANMAAGDIRVRQRFVTTVTLPGYTPGANNDNAAVVAYLAGRNTLVNTPSATATNEVAVTAGAGGFINGGACTQPVFP